ncbi:MAG: sigma-70 family RNA polymerase sigma factor [Deltaproteobacteria bacterium]|jgi:RNA polymerase sigma factor (sigma-70 family)|nr:sigma-70 family RNA polymerase sigma factor [Deltaproteobacteria bacterium]
MTRTEPPTTTEDDRALLSAVYREHSRGVFNLVRRMGVRREDLCVVTTEAFHVFWTRRAEYDPARGSQRSWLMGIAVKVAVHHLRSRFRDWEDTVDLESAVLRSPGPSPEAEASRAQDRGLLGDLLDGLPGAQRTVFVLHHVEGMSLTEIAEILGVSKNTAASRLRLAREHLSRETAKLRRLRGDP